MIVAACRVVLALAIASVPLTALAQVIPPSEQPGRERERFIEPAAPRAQPGGTAISLPSTVAPAGADKLNLFVRDLRIVGSTVYNAEQLRLVYGDIVGREVSLAAIYE